jgi:hypothetical protein
MIYVVLTSLAKICLLRDLMATDKTKQGLVAWWVTKHCDNVLDASLLYSMSSGRAVPSEESMNEYVHVN